MNVRPTVAIRKSHVRRRSRELRDVGVEFDEREPSGSASGSRHSAPPAADDANGDGGDEEAPRHRGRPKSS